MPNTSRIRELNDNFRRTFSGGLVQMTGAIYNHPYRDRILQVVKVFDDFNPDNDPYGEHDWASFAVPNDLNRGRQPDDIPQNEVVVFKLDYYDADSMEHGSPDPSDESKTFRVMTILLASEY